MPRRPLGDVVIMLPGITGSVLQVNGKDVWAFSGGAIVRALFSLGGSIRDLALDKDPADADDLGDGVTAPRVMQDIHLVPGLWKIDGYGKIADTIRGNFEAADGENFFEFPYDWRRDNRVAARMLARRSHEWLTAWRERSGNAEAKLVLVGHSMGGLVARYFLECLDGWKDTRALVTFGTPYRGALNAVSFIANGMRKSLGPLTLVDLSGLLRSFTSVYQLLPIYPCFDSGDGQMVRVAEAETIPNLDRDRAEEALAFHREIEAAVEEHRKDDEYLEWGYRIHPVVGTFQHTLQSARLVDDRLEVFPEYGGEDQDGDGTVPRVSATPIELSGEGREMFASERHATLQNRDAVLVQLIGILSAGELDLDQYRVVPLPRVGLDLDDAFDADEPVSFRLRSEDEAAELIAVVTDTETGAEVARRDGLHVADEWAGVELAPLPPGTYRLSVDSIGAVDPVSDIFTVAEPAPA